MVNQFNMRAREMKKEISLFKVIVYIERNYQMVQKSIFFKGSRKKITVFF